MSNLKICNAQKHPATQTPIDRNRFTREQNRGGYTLLEILISMALFVVLLGGISMAINYHLVVLQEQQDEIERTQIARQSLFLITKDIRAAIQYKPISTSALNELIESVASATESIEQIAGELGGDEATEIPDPDDDPAASQYSATRPGLYGTASELQIDVSRLPRADQYSLVNYSDGTSSDIPSDVKTVSYLVRKQNSDDDDSQEVDISQKFGLIRRSLDRAVNRYATDYGGQLNLEDYEVVLATEISQIEFRYWDQENEEWLTEWDSDEMLGLPKAVEITVAIGEESTDEEESRKIYRSVVYLPVAELIPPEETAPAETADESTSDSADSADDSSGGDR